MAVKFRAEDFHPDIAKEKAVKVIDRTAECAGMGFQFIGGVRPSVTDERRKSRPVGEIVYDPNADVSDIKPRDATAEWMGVGVQIIGGVGPPDSPNTETPKQVPDADRPRA